MIKAGYGRRALRDRGVPALFALMAMEMGILTMPSTAAAFLYVANTGANTVTVFDTATSPPSLVATVPVGTNPAGVSLSPDGKRVYVANTTSNNVSVIDTTTSPPSVIATIPVGTSPSVLAVTPDGNRVYVVNQFSNNVSIITTTTAPPSVIATIPVGAFPNGVAAGAAGNRVYVANSVSGTISVVDNALTPPAVASTIGVGDLQPFGVAVTPDGKNLYVTLNGENTVLVIDTTKTPPPPGPKIGVGAFPTTVAISPDGTRAFVANSGSSTVSVIDTTTAPPSALFMIPVGPRPNGISITADAKRAYVADSTSNTISVIDIPVPAFVTGPGPVGVALAEPAVCVLFLTFNPTLSVVLGHTANTDNYNFQASFTVGSAAPSINPLTQPVTIQVGNSNLIIPPGSFKHNDAGYTFTGVINGVSLKVQITPNGTLRYTFSTTATGANLAGIKNPVPVGLTIGGNCGKASVTAKITP
ncbi:beta-propeller fold lactonase family protein [Methylocapsa sp. D3K7]|uniref:beta-propeller fold lactonase family protein n=1 Tax=Methylocapsa sp. D3K7 TaxID=3041435 RepID=UPI00244ECB75|nr:beta-propeller fold lactonase family protein [Methylocapsa sp. D3K7]WGJ13629.1 beta-propeller fold lactonase family protein [Methylocapsa sp. D3K7]